MRICDLQSGIGRLQRESKKLQEQWIETKADWNDATCREFEQTYLEPLLPNLRLALAAAYEFAETIHEAEVACRDDQFNL
ncbi:MAG TPA: hypothetical protein VIY86_11245 [Pirellulaceae bacterium]